MNELLAMLAAEKAAGERRDTIRRQLGERLCREREALHRTRREVAVELRTTAAQIVGIENGSKWPRALVGDMIAYYARANTVIGSRGEPIVVRGAGCQ